MTGLGEPRQGYVAVATLTEASCAAAFERLDGHFAHRAAALGGGTRLSFEIAGHPVAMRLAGERLVRSTLAALGHLRGAGGTAGLSIRFWDQAECGGGDEVLPGEWRAAGDRVLATCPSGRYLLRRHLCLTGLLDRERGQAVGWVDDAGRMPAGAAARPFDPFPGCWIADRGVLAVHASAVAHGEAGAALMIGRSGAGKTTTALACALAGMEFLGEENVPLTRDPARRGGFVAHGSFATALVADGHLARFPALRGIAQPDHFGGAGKAMVPLADLPGIRLARSARLAACLLPCVVPDQAATTVEPAPRTAALRVAVQSLLGLAWRPRQVDLDGFAEVLDTVPVYRLNLGRDIATIAPAVRALLDSLR